MKEKKYGKLSNKAKALGILTVCLIFVCVCAICLRLQNRTNQIVFGEKNLELKTAYAIDGNIRSEAPSESEDNTFATKPFILPAGDYMIELVYMSSAPGYIYVQGNNDCVFSIDLPVTYGENQIITDGHLSLVVGTDKGRMKFYQTGDGLIEIKKLRIMSDNHIYNDYYVIIGLAALISIALIVIILVFNRLRLSRIGFSYIGLLIIAMILVNIPFCIKGTYYEVDTQAHMKRIEAIAQGIRDGQWPVLIGPNYANHYGELVALQPGLFLYLPAFLRLLNVTVPTAYNIYMIFVNIATAVAAVVCGERYFTSLRWGIVAAVFYLVEPFRLYVMMALGAGAGMGTALIFLPFLLVGLHETMDRGGFRWKYITVGLWGMACSHVMGFALAVLVMIIYILFHIKQLFNKDVFIALVKAAFAFIILTVGVLAPFIGYYFTDWNRTALQWTDFYHFPVERVREVLNVISLLVIVISYIALRKTVHISRFGRGIFLTGFISILMSLPIFPWFLFGKIPAVDSFLSMMQYPMRFHFAAVLPMAFVAAEAVCSNMDSRRKHRKAVMYSIVGLLGVGVIANYITFYNADKLFDDPVTGEINTLMEDYLPGGTLTEWYDNDTGEFSDYDKVEAYSYSKINTHVDCTYTSSDDGQYMEFPLFYYEGYAACDQNGIPLKVEKGEHNRVRVYLNKSYEIQELHLSFVVKRTYKLLFFFSLAACVVWFTYNIGFLAYRAVRSGRITYRTAGETDGKTVPEE